jgi:hypothetical protein
MIKMHMSVILAYLKELDVLALAEKETSESVMNSIISIKTYLVILLKLFFTKILSSPSDKRKLEEINNLKNLNRQLYQYLSLYFTSMSKSGNLKNADISILEKNFEKFAIIEGQ